MCVVTAKNLELDLVVQQANASRFFRRSNYHELNNHSNDIERVGNLIKNKTLKLAIASNQDSGFDVSDDIEDELDFNMDDDNESVTGSDNDDADDFAKFDDDYFKILFDPSKIKPNARLRLENRERRRQERREEKRQRRLEEKQQESYESESVSEVDNDTEDRSDVDSDDDDSDLGSDDESEALAFTGILSTKAASRSDSSPSRTSKSRDSGSLSKSEDTSEDSSDYESDSDSGESSLDSHASIANKGRTNYSLPQTQVDALLLSLDSVTALQYKAVQSKLVAYGLITTNTQEMIEAEKDAEISKIPDTQNISITNPIMPPARPPPPPPPPRGIVPRPPPPRPHPPTMINHPPTGPPTGPLPPTQPHPPAATHSLQHGHRDTSKPDPTTTPKLLAPSFNVSDTSTEDAAFVQLVISHLVKLHKTLHDHRLSSNIVTSARYRYFLKRAYLQYLMTNPFYGYHVTPAKLQPFNKTSIITDNINRDGETIQ